MAGPPLRGLVLADASLVVQLASVKSLISVGIPGVVWRRGRPTLSTGSTLTG